MGKLRGHSRTLMSQPPLEVSVQTPHFLLQCLSKTTLAGAMGFGTCSWVGASIPTLSLSHASPQNQAEQEGPYQFFKTRVVISAAMTMMRDTVIVII